MKLNRYDFLTKRKISKVLSESNLQLLLSSFLLDIKKKKNTVIVCPVGDKKELKNFGRYLKDSGINKLADVIFVYKKGLDFVRLDGIDAMHVKEKIPLGTSGAFFTATYLGYLLGYEVIVVSDINVFIDSKKSFIECVELAKKKGKVVFPICTAQEDANPDKAVSYNVNGFTFYPRKVFEITGFHTPYTWRGGEDFEFLIRLMERSLVYVNKNAHVSHPRAGYTVFHKMVDKKKFYPYVAGLMKAFLFHSDHPSAALKFIIWYVFYSFFADVFSDRELLKTIEKAPYFLAYYPTDTGKKKFEIRKVRKKGVYPYSSLLRLLTTPVLLASLLFSKKARIYTDEIVLRTSRLSIFFGLIKASFLIPLRTLQAFLVLGSWKKTRKTLIYPVKPKNAKKAIKVFAELIEKSNLA